MGMNGTRIKSSNAHAKRAPAGDDNGEHTKLAQVRHQMHTVCNDHVLCITVRREDEVYHYCFWRKREADAVLTHDLTCSEELQSTG
jgi:hypothetical protein